MPRAHPLSYPVARKDDDHPLKPFMRRDLCATNEILFPLYSQGFTQGEPIFNQPPEEAPAVPPVERYHVDLSYVAEKDLIVHCGRPPIHDVEAGPKKQVERAYTDLEDYIFEVWLRLLSWCARDQIGLKPALADLLRPGFKDRRQMKLQQNGVFGPYLELNGHDGTGWHKPDPESPRRTPLFLLRVERAWKGGPGYLGAFGADGCATQLFAYRLARDLAYLLEKPGFCMAELEIGEMPERVTDLRWCLDWKIEVLLQHDPQRALARV